MSEKHIDVTERLQKIGQTANEYKDALTSHFKDMDVERLRTGILLLENLNKNISLRSTLS